ncbi:MAG: hypothetical protein A2297_07010 [Elusimicrobia bacterium RIFOXYB2_FULL_48_7]|nr:MAG: hypothetical protein A2297_07010 [Elusimicrobia bacterium RIFOXYB2_FULL_48_7]
MKILTRYIYKESLKAFVTGIIVFTFVLVLNNLFQLIDLLINKGAGLLVVLQLVVYLVMTLFSITIPMSLLFSVLMTYGRLAEDREIMALSSAGINTFRFTFQPVVLALIFSLTLSWLNLQTIPTIHSEFSRIYLSIAKKQPLLKFEEKAFTKISNYRIYVNEIDKNTNELKGINIYKFTPSVSLITAKTGTAAATDKTITFDLHDGIMQSSPADSPEKMTLFAFDKYTISIPLLEEHKDETHMQSLREVPSGELLKIIKYNKQQKLPATQLEIEYHLRWVVGFAVLSLVLVGLPASIILNRGGRTINFAISIAIICFYYFILIGCISLAENFPRIPAVYVLWIPNAATLAIGVFLMRKVLKK